VARPASRPADWLPPGVTLAGSAVAIAGVSEGRGLEAVGLAAALVGVGFWLALDLRHRASRGWGLGAGLGPVGVAGAAALLASAALIAAGPAAALGVAAALALGLWWTEGAREGRRLREALIASVGLSLTANFISSWAGLVAGLPAGALARDAAFLVLLLATAGGGATGQTGSSSRLLAYAALAAVVIASLDTAGGLPAIVGARTYLLYPVLLLAPAWRMSVSGRLAVARAMVALLAAMAVIGLLEVATRGGILTTLGYRADFAETATTSASPYFAGFRRATGGLGNFLEFGLVMNIGLLMARATLRGHWRAVAMVLFASAAFLSWSRLSWALVLLVALIPLDIVGQAVTRVQARRLLGAVVVVVVAMLFFTLGPGQIAKDRILGTDRVTQRSTSTRESQLSTALAQAGTRLVGTGPGTQGAAADRTSGRAQRTVTDNGYLIWLLELGWLGFAAIILLAYLVAVSLVAAGSWWAVALLAMLAIANGLFAAGDSRVVLAVGFVALRLLWTPRVTPQEAEARPWRVPAHPAAVARAGWDALQPAAVAATAAVCAGTLVSDAAAVDAEPAATAVGGPGTSSRVADRRRGRSPLLRASLIMLRLLLRRAERRGRR
jgi:hypothetical protein